MSSIKYNMVSKKVNFKQLIAVRMKCFDVIIIYDCVVKQKIIKIG